MHPKLTWQRISVLSATLLIAVRSVAAFPLLDATVDQVPHGTDLAAPDAQDLRHQLQFANGLSAPPGGGWTVVPRVDWQAELTDNVLQQHTPRRPDIATFVAPGVGIAGDLPKVRLTFDFAPTLAIYGRSGNLDSLTEEMVGLGNITLVPEIAFVDFRAVAGLTSIGGGLGGLGSVGVSGDSLIPSLAGNAQGLNKSNEVETSSFGISPYLLHRFGDWGYGRLGASFNAAQSTPISGFAASPIPTGGADAQTLLTNEQTAHFMTGEIMPFAQDSIDIDLQQTQTSFGPGLTGTATGRHISSNRAIVTDEITYEVSRAVAVFASGGHEDIHYAGIGLPSIHDLIWSLGTTLTPNADSLLTVSYGHLNGFNSFTANGHYDLTPRTQFTASYATSLGTQLETLQSQLNLAAVSTFGTLVNGQTGGQLFGSVNALGVQSGVFRTNTLTVGGQTSLERDIISLDILITKQTGIGIFSEMSNSSKSASITWLHQMRPNLLFSGVFAYAIQDQTTGPVSLANPGNNTSIVTSLALQLQISGTLRGILRYSFLDRQSAAAAFDIYQNLLIAGISKSF